MFPFPQTKVRRSGPLTIARGSCARLSGEAQIIFHGLLPSSSQFSGVLVHQLSQCLQLLLSLRQNDLLGLGLDFFLLLTQRSTETSSAGLPLITAFQGEKPLLHIYRNRHRVKLRPSPNRCRSLKLSRRLRLGCAPARRVRPCRWSLPAR